MSLTTNLKKERFSLAYVQAIAARAGVNFVEPKVDTDSVDGILLHVVGKRPQINFQAKATSQPIVRDGRLAFPLPIKNYDDLRCEVVVPRILIVLVMPSDTSCWIDQTDDELILRNCCYWVSLLGLPPSDNVTTVTVSIPKTQRFDELQLAELLRKAETGDVL